MKLQSRLVWWSVVDLVQFRRMEKAQLLSRLVWWSAVLFNLEDWMERLEKAQLQSRLVWWSVVLLNLEYMKKRSCKVDWSGSWWSCST
jgi:hypothetical protein